MTNIIKQKITFDESLKQRLEFICEFSHTTSTFINDYKFAKEHDNDKEKDDYDLEI